MTHATMERLTAERNAAEDAGVARARLVRTACDVTPMLAFGGISYCRTHRVMGPCPYVAPEAVR